MRTATTLRSKLLHSENRPSLLPLQSHIAGICQTRSLTQQFLRRTEEAQQQWEQWAKEIKEGKRQNFVQHLESRGLIHDVVG